jgi:hypothetical protein
MAVKYYQPSGQYSVLTILTLFSYTLLTLVTGVGLGISYWLINNIYLSLILTILVIFLLRKFFGLANYSGKNRSFLISLMFAVIASLTFVFGFLLALRYLNSIKNNLYTKYFDFQGTSLGFEGVNHSLDSLKLFFYNTSNILSIGSLNATNLLYILILGVFLALLLIYKGLKVTAIPFDESTNTWFRVYKRVFREYIPITQEMLSNLELGIFEGIKNLKPRSAKIGDSYSEHVIYYNGSTSKPHYFLYIENKLPSSDNGKSFFKKPVMDLIEISQSKLTNTYTEIKAEGQEMTTKIQNN